MQKRWMSMALKFVLLAPLFIAVLGFGVKYLWNWLMPALFGWHLITFWQAVGILILSKVLFGGFRGGAGRHMHMRHRMKERWEHMTPEEREKYRNAFGGRCGSFVPPAEAPKA